MRVLATDRDLDQLRHIASSSAWPEDRVFTARLDVTSAEGWSEALDIAEARFGRLDLLLNVAGIMRAEWIQDTPLDDIDAVVDVDLKGVMLGTRFAARHMIRFGGGHIVNVSSMLGLTPGPGLSIYTGAKYGVRGFTLSAALELEAHGIAVTLVCPDRVESGLFDFPNVHAPQAAISWSGPDAVSPEKLAHAILRDVVARRPLVYCMPRRRGMMARCSELLPASMMRRMYAFLSARGMRRQLEFTTRQPLPPAPACAPQSSPAPPANPPPSPTAAAVETHAACDVQGTYEAARSATAGLRASTLDQRLAWIRRIKEFLIESRDDLAREIARETGKSNFEAMASELMFAISSMDYDMRHARKALRPERVKRPVFHFKKKSTVHYEPLGVVLVLAPYNYPLALALLPAIEAVLAGNAVILKPSERCPLASIWQRLLDAADLPAGVFQIRHGDSGLASELIEAGPDHIHLTGGSETGAKVAEHAARKLIPVSAELGGKDVAVVFPGADLDRAVECLVWAFLVNQGQTCASIKRLLVHESIYDSFLARFVARIEVVSGGDSSGSKWSWQHTPFRADQAGSWIDEALASGARVLFPKDPMDRDAWLSGPLSPVIVGNVGSGTPLWQGETWGPLLAAASFSSESEAVRSANNSRFGLGASVWTNDPAQGQRMASALDVGFVSINNALSTMTNPALPYGGCKASGWGRVRGEFGLRTFCNIKSVLVDHGTSMEPYWHPYTAVKTRLFSDLLHGTFGRGMAGKWRAFKAAGYFAKFCRRK